MCCHGEIGRVPSLVLRFDLTHMEVADGGALALAKTLPSCTHMLELCLGHNGITTFGITEMSGCDQGGPLPSVSKLDLTRNNFDEVGARALLDNLRGSKELEFLTLDKTLHLLRGEHQRKPGWGRHRGRRPDAPSAVR